MKWKSSGSEQNEDTDALKKHLHAEGFDAYKRTGRPGGAYLDYIHSLDEVVCVLSGTAGVEVPRNLLGKSCYRRR